MPALRFPGLTIPPASSINAVGQGRALPGAGDRTIVALTYGAARQGGRVLNVIPAAPGSGTVLISVLWGLAGDGVSDVQLNDAALPSGATVTTYTGGQSSADAALVAAFTAAGRAYTDNLAGYQYSVVAMPSRAFEGELNFTALVRGRKVYDPRQDSTAGGSGSQRLANAVTWAWSDNPALALADFLASATYGAGEALDWASVSATATACDQLVGGEKRRLLGVCFAQDVETARLADTLRAYAGCWLVPGAAGMRLVPDQDAEPVAAYSHASGHIAGLDTLQLRDMSSAPTALEVLYTDTTATPWRERSVTVTVTGAGTTLPWRLSQVVLPGVQRYSQAKREATERLNKLRLGDLTTTLDVWDRGVAHEIGDIISVTHPRGLTGKLFRISEQPVLAAPGRWRLSLVEHDPAVYSTEVATQPSTPDTVLVSPAGPPAATASLTYAEEAGGIRLRWLASPESDVVEYELRVGASWAVGTPLDGALPTIVGGTTYLWNPPAPGAYQVRIKPRDNAGTYALADAEVTVTVSPPAAPVVTFAVSGPDYVLQWTEPASSASISDYEVRYGTDWGSAVSLGVLKARVLRARVNWGGARRFLVAAIAGGVTGAVGTVDTAIAAPGAVTSARSEVIDNNAMLYWLAPSTLVLPVDRYEVRRGVSFAAGTVVGSNGNSTFAAVFEQSAGTYTYWVAAVDTAGNVGAATALTATINQPPDYVLRNNINSALGGTTSNFTPYEGGLLGPVNTTETISEHYTSRGWSSPQDQIDAGYPLYIQPSLTSATYEEIVDYGAVLPATIITVTPAVITVAGAVTVGVQLYVKSAAADPWVAQPAGLASVLAPAFRYLRVVLTITSTTAGTGLGHLTALNIKLANKLKTDSGTFTITDANAGAWVPFGVEFVAADQPIAQGAGLTPLLPVIDYVPVPYPEGFRVYLVVPTTGAKAIGSGSWAARGY